LFGEWPVRDRQNRCRAACAQVRLFAEERRIQRQRTGSASSGRGGSGALETSQSLSPHASHDPSYPQLTSNPPSLASSRPGLGGRPSSAGGGGGGSVMGSGQAGAATRYQRSHSGRAARVRRSAAWAWLWGTAQPATGRRMRTGGRRGGIKPWSLIEPYRAGDEPPARARRRLGGRAGRAHRRHPGHAPHDVRAARARRHQRGVRRPGAPPRRRGARACGGAGAAPGRRAHAHGAARRLAAPGDADERRLFVSAPVLAAGGRRRWGAGCACACERSAARRRSRARARRRRTGALVAAVEQRGALRDAQRPESCPGGGAPLAARSSCHPWLGAAAMPMTAIAGAGPHESARVAPRRLHCISGSVWRHA